MNKVDSSDRAHCKDLATVPRTARHATRAATEPMRAGRRDECFPRAPARGHLMADGGADHRVGDGGNATASSRHPGTVGKKDEKALDAATP
ncbi:MAG: hypothetical protein V2J24_11825 [Pseudomonadales bacterium]|jgi:hypothetical protein|nr:hypothetical protein [Pseudomonadales bacterium]